MELKIYIKTAQTTMREVHTTQYHRPWGGRKKTFHMNDGGVRVSVRGLDVRAIACEKILCCGKLKTIKRDAKWNIFYGLVWFRLAKIFALRATLPPAFILRCCVLFVFCLLANLQVIYHSRKNVKLYFCWKHQNECTAKWYIKFMFWAQ